MELVNDRRHRVAGHGPPSKNHLRRSLARVTGRREIGEIRSESEEVKNEYRRILFLKPEAQTGGSDGVQSSEQRREGEGFRYDMRCMDELADAVSEDRYTG